VAPAPHAPADAKQIHLAAHFPGVNNTTVWSDPASGSHIEFDSFERFARSAERGKFDFLFLAEGLRLREQNGRVYDLDVVGRPDTFTVLAALAAVTEHLGLTGTVNSTFNEPYEVARQFASLDHLSGGRAAWNVVTSWDAFTGENFRRGGYLAQGDRYDWAKTFLAAAAELWDSWRGDEVVADKDSGQFLSTPGVAAYLGASPVVSPAAKAACRAGELATRNSSKVRGARPVRSRTAGVVAAREPSATSAASAATSPANDAGRPRPTSVAASSGGVRVTGVTVRPSAADSFSAMPALVSGSGPVRS
jgi:alkanesulfonate monooxygenase SsuD/methylene tetrahydromethanopterin reductase-like flavin-dependent oxidoreductase (luciferase family)